MIELEGHLAQWSRDLSAVQREAAGYTHRIVAIGYGVSFAVWGFVRSFVDTRLQALAGLLLIASAIPFAIWEVAMTIVSTRNAQVLASATTQEEAVLAVEEYARRSREASKVVMKAWPFVVGWCLMLGLVGIAVLVAGLVCHLVTSL